MSSIRFSFIDFAKIYIDWNIDGDFDDLNELVGQINPTQSPSIHTINFTVPSNFQYLDTAE